MSIKQAVTTTFKNRDNDPSLFPKMGKKSKKFGETTSKAFKKASKSATTFGSVTKGILAAGAVQKALGGVSAGIVSVTTDFLNFDQALTAASAKLIKAKLGSKEFKEEFNALGKSAREVGATTEFNAAQAAAGLDFLALAGFNAAQAMKLLPGVANLATVANVDLATATDIASDSLGAFGLMTKNTEQLGINFARVQDVMAKTTATSNTNLIDLFESVKKGAPDFTAAGQSIETFSTLVGTMANAGIKGSEAGTKLRNMATRLAKPTEAAEILMGELGIRVQDSSGNFRDMLSILDDVRKGTAKMGKVQRTAALATIFGVRQTGGLNVILAESDKKLRKYRTTLEESTGAAKNMAEVMRSSLINRLKSLGSAATEVGFQLFSAFSETGSNAIERLTQFVRKIDLTPMINGIRTIAGVAGSIFNKFLEIGRQTGLFSAVQTAINQIKPAVEAMFEIIKTVWSFLDKSGTLRVLATSLKGVAKAAGQVATDFKDMWNTVKPIIEALDKALAPLTKTIKLLRLDKVDISGAVSDAINPLSLVSDTVKSTAFQAVFNPNFQKNRESAAQTRRIAEAQAPGRLRAEQRQQVNFNGQLNISGAPEGSTAETEEGPISISMDKMAPAPAF